MTLRQTNGGHIRKIKVQERETDQARWQTEWEQVLELKHRWPIGVPIYYRFIQACISIHTNLQIHSKNDQLSILSTYCLSHVGSTAVPTLSIMKEQESGADMKKKTLCCAALTKGPSHMCSLLAEILGLTNNRPMQKQGGICGFVLIFSVMADTEQQ